MGALSFRDVKILARAYFGDRMSEQYVYREGQVIGGNLYEAVPIACVMDPMTGRITAGVRPWAEPWFPEDSQAPFEAVSGDESAVRAMFAELDGYCRLRLPEEYLARFNEPFDERLRVFGSRRLGSPDEPDLPFDELYRLVTSFFGPKLSLVTSDDSARTITGLLYDAFPLSCGYDERRTLFGAGIWVTPGSMIRSFLGSSTPMACNRSSLQWSLELVDEYCRLRLPDKYLEAFDAAYVPASADRRLGGE